MGALIAPSKTPRSIVDRVYNEVKTALATPEVQEQMKKLFFEPVGNSPDEFAAALRDEETRWSEIIDRAGLRKK